MIRILLSLLILLASLLTVVRAPLNSLWKLSIVVLEGGHFAVIPCLLLGALALRTGGLPGKLSGTLLLGAALLFATPVARAFSTAHRTRVAFSEGFARDFSPAAPFRRTRVLTWRELFLGVRFPKPAFKTFAYAEHDGDSLRLDYYPARRKRAPCVVVVHGGGWDSGKRGELADLNGYLQDLGYAVADIDYRLAPRYRYPAPVEDVRDALAWLRGRADSLGIDPDRIVLLGRSAGGQIVLQAAYTLRNAGVRGVIAFYAPADMVFGYSIPGNPRILDSRKVLRNYLGGSYPDAPAAYVASSPFEALRASSPPTLLLHGRPDVLVSFRHTVHMEEKLTRLGVPHFTVDLPWATHGFDYVFSGPGSQISLYFIERFLAQVVE